MKMRICLLGIVALLLMACSGEPGEPGNSGPEVNEPAEAADVDSDPREESVIGQDGSDPEDAADEDDRADQTIEDAEQEAPDTEGADGQGPDTERVDGEEPDTERADDGHGAGDRLSAVLAIVAEMVGDDADIPDDHCQPLSEWTNVAATLAGSLEDNARKDGSWETRGGELVQFGCGFGWHAPGEGFGSLAVLVSVYVNPTELPSGFEETSTPAGMPAFAGQGELEDDLVWMSGGPVSAAVAEVGEHELRVTSQPDLLEPDELLAVLDAAWDDLSEFG